MKPAGKIVVISHCILNQNAVVHGLERAKGAFPLAIELLQQDISFLQLPCPELLALGAFRPPMDYEDYAKIPGYREKCQAWLQPTIIQLLKYQEIGMDYLGVIGIQGSPNCSISRQRGVLMEEFFKLLAWNNLPQRYIEVPDDYSEEYIGDFHKKLEQFIHGTGGEEH